LLAYRPRSQWDALIPDKLVRHTDKTLVQRSDVLADLEEIRRAGFAIERGENEDGATCIAAPILDSNGVSLAAVSISAPSSRVTNALTDEMIEELAKCCAIIAASFIRDVPVSAER